MSLSECLGCGYYGEVESTRLGTPDRQRQSAANGVAGASTQVTFTWDTNALAAGSYAVKLQYLPPGMGAQPDGTFTATIELK